MLLGSGHSAAFHSRPETEGEALLFSKNLFPEKHLLMVLIHSLIRMTVYIQH